MIYKVKVTTKKVARKVGYFSVALLLSSTAWNRYIAYYQDILEKNDVTVQQFEKQNFVIKVRKLKVWEISEILIFKFLVDFVLHCRLHLANYQRPRDAPSPPTEHFLR